MTLWDGLVSLWLWEPSPEVGWTIFGVNVVLGALAGNAGVPLWATLVGLGALNALVLGAIYL